MTFSESVTVFAVFCVMAWPTAMVVAQKPRISIAGLTFVEKLSATPVLPWNTGINAEQRQSAVAELGMEYLRKNFGNTFEFDNKMLYDPARPSSNQLADDAENLVGQFYFEHRNTSDGMALLSSCSNDQFTSSRITKALRMINMCSVGNGLTLQEHPERISISIYPGTGMLRFLTLMIDQNRWTSVVALIEQASIEHEPFGRGINLILGGAFRNRTRNGVTYRYTPIQFNLTTGIKEVEGSLKKFSQISRVGIIYGSGEAAKAIMQTAESLNMTNGEYVFIMLALQVHGGIKTKDGIPNDTDWIYSPANAHLNLRYQVYPSKSVLLLSYEAVYTEQSIYGLHHRLLELSRTKYNVTYFEEQIPMMMFGSYEEFLIYGIVLNDTYTTYGRVLDGPDLVQHFLNRTFNLSTGELFINKDGERMMDILGDVLADTGKFQTMMRYDHRTDRLTPQEPMNRFWPGHNWPPPNEPECGFLGNVCAEREALRQQVLTGATAGSLIALLTAVTVIVVWLWHQSIMLNSTWWRVTEADIHEPSSRLSVFRAQADNVSHGTKKRATRTVRLTTGELAWKTVLAPQSDVKLNVSRDLLKFLLHINQLQHVNVNHFIGIIVDSAPLSIVETHCKRGSLDDVFEASKIDMDMAFSFLMDLVQGATYIHGSFLKCHGNLTSSKCLLDAQFGLKISDVANESLASILKLSGSVRNAAVKYDSRSRCDRLFWTAPEVLRGGRPSNKGDIYSFGILAYQVLTGRVLPYDDVEFSNQEIIEKVQSQCLPPFRPPMDFEASHFSYKLTIVHDLIARCWTEDRQERPNWSEINSKLRKSMREAGLDENRSLFDRVMARLTRYSTNLEEVVEQRTEQLLLEREKCDVILGEMLPRPVIALLRSGQSVLPEEFEICTVMFSDIVGFIDFVDRSSPLVVMEFLHLVYSRFDEVVSRYQVYKVETIGDSYMVASGLPERNGKDHTRQICRLALALMKLFPKLHTAKGIQPDDKKMNLRIGIHSGAVVAGVVGNKTPRYCLFGDTINTASRMESHGLPSRIHVSESAASLAEEAGFLLLPRGKTEIKGKGAILTFWLDREISEPDYAPEKPEDEEQDSGTEA